VTTPVFGSRSIRSFWLLFVALFAWSADSHAQDQFVLVDQTYTATAQNTSMSQYTIAPKTSGVPSNLKSPTDYTMGSVNVRYEVLEKPSDKPTLWGICFETANVLTCMPTPPSYTAPNVYTYSAAFSKFWQFSMFDWTKPIEKVLTTLKDGSMAAVQGDASYYPTKVHVTVTVVPPGKTFDPGDEDAGTPSKPAKPPTTPAAGGGSGSAGRSMTPGAGAGRGGQATAAGGSGTNAFDAGPATAGSAGLGAGGKSGTRASASTAAGSSAGDINAYVDPGSSCAAVSGKSHSPLSAAGIAIGLVVGWLRRRRARAIS
jgi:hypothetical protein